MPREEKKKIETGDQPVMTFDPFASVDFSVLELKPETAENKTSTPPKDAHAPATPSKKGRVLLRKETAHRAGKTVIVAYDFPPTTHSKDLEILCKELKKKCGTGGLVRGRELEIQGDLAQKVAEFLEQQGYRVGGVRN